jgi:hypothetical protein
MWFDLLERANPSNKLDTIASNVIFQQNASMALAKGISYINNCQFALHSFSGMAWDVDVNITISHFPASINWNDPAAKRVGRRYWYHAFPPLHIPWSYHTVSCYMGSYGLERL